MPAGICLRTAPEFLRWIKAPLPLDLPLPCLRPVLQEARPPPPLEGLGHFSPSVKHRQASGRHACFQLWVAIQIAGTEVTKPCAQDWGGTGRTRPLFTPHSPLGTRVQPGHISHHVQFPPLNGM